MGRVCVSIGERGHEACEKALKGTAFAEIRLDKAGLGRQDTARLFSFARAAGKELIATCRPDGGMDMVSRSRLLSTAIVAGAKFVDVEVESIRRYRECIARKARAAGCRIIVSYHNYEMTPETAVLKETVERCFGCGADIAKIACMVNEERDGVRLLSLLDGASAAQIVVIGMGQKGKITRVAAPLLGSPFTFASASAGKETAVGQIDKATLEEMHSIIES